jgi:hypothetical protein
MVGPRQSLQPDLTVPTTVPGHVGLSARVRGIALLVAVGLIVFVASGSFRFVDPADVVVPGVGVTRRGMLSEYFPALAGSPGDTAVYVMEGELPGGSVLVLGGVHADEPASYLTAILLIESGTVRQGTAYVIPFANASAVTNNLPGEGVPQSFAIATEGGERVFPNGSRYTNPIHSWPDAEVYVHHPSGQRLSGEETRNLNRAFPGRPDGNLTERIAFGITELIRQEEIDLTIDLHTAMPEYPNINVIVAHERSMILASMAQIDMMIDGISISLSPSPPMFHGLSHRELGDHTETLATLLEAPNIAIGRLRGQTTVSTILDAQDPFYVWGDRLGRLFVPFDDGGWPLAVRVGRHVAGVRALTNAMSDMNPNRSIRLELPTYASIVERGVGAFLNPPP